MLQLLYGVNILSDYSIRVVRCSIRVSSDILNVYISCSASCATSETHLLFFSVSGH